MRKLLCYELEFMLGLCIKDELWSYFYGDRFEIKGGYKFCVEGEILVGRSVKFGKKCIKIK